MTFPLRLTQGSCPISRIFGVQGATQPNPPMKRAGSWHPHKRGHWPMLALLFAFAIGSKAALAEDTPPISRELSVQGSAQINTIPDQAMINIGAVANNADPEDAIRQLSARLEEIIAVLKLGGVEEKHIQTSSLSVHPNWKKQEIISFVARSSLSVMIDDLDGLPRLLGALARGGMNDLGGLSYSSSKARELEEEAMKEAVADARRKAEILASSAGMKLGLPSHISYNTQHAGPMPIARAAKMEMADASFDVPMAEGEVSVRADVDMRFELLEE